MSADGWRPSVVVVGSVHTDFVATAHRLPVPGETLPARSFATFPGGKGGNQAIAAARAGARVRMIGRVGADRYGDDLRAALVEAGVAVDSLAADPKSATGASLVLADGSGEYLSMIVPGAGLRMLPRDVEENRGVIALADAVVGQLEIGIDATLAALRIARAAGAITVLNAAPVPERPDDLPADVWPAIDILIANGVEAAMLVGDGSGDDPLASAIALQRQTGVARVVVTAGAAGAAAAGPDRAWLDPGHRVDVVDTIGAGDAFVAALTVALASGADFSSAVRWANAAGALAVTKPGGSGSAPTGAEIDAFLATAG